MVEDPDGCIILEAFQISPKPLPDVGSQEGLIARNPSKRCGSLDLLHDLLRKMDRNRGNLNVNVSTSGFNKSQGNLYAIYT